MSNNTSSEIKFAPLTVSRESSTLNYAPSCVLELDGDIRHDPKKPQWSLAIDYVSMRESTSGFVCESEVGSVALEYSIGHRIYDGIKVCIKTSLKEEQELSLETFNQEPELNAADEELPDLQYPDDLIPTEIPIQIPIENDEDFDSIMLNSKYDPDEPAIITTLMNKDTACVGEGVMKNKSNPTLTYPGVFLGIRILFDLGRNEIVHVAKDDDGSANWYEEPYQVIIYPTGIASCPFLTLAVCLWAVDLSK
jgi:hypothetical protein